jgi:hypothetical protein
MRTAPCRLPSISNYVTAAHRSGTYKDREEYYIATARLSFPALRLAQSQERQDQEHHDDQTDNINHRVHCRLHRRAPDIQPRRQTINGGTGSEVPMMQCWCERPYRRCHANRMKP